MNYAGDSEGLDRASTVAGSRITRSASDHDSIIIASVIVSFLAAFIVLITYFCVRAAENRRGADVRGGGDGVNNASKDDVEAGLNEATMKSWPRITYGEAKSRGGRDSTGESLCAVCLAEYEEDEELWRLPECGHQFHVKCADLWLRRQPTCPLCRTTPMPNHLPASLTEVVD